MERSTLMMVAMTMVVRDEVDVIDANLAFHLAVGVDLILVTNHGSKDGTEEVLARYEDTGRVWVFREGGERTQQGMWATQMARLAAGRGADWVLHSDADEFWWPRGGSLTDALAVVPARYGVVEGLQRSFPPVDDDGRLFWERMTIRLAGAAAINDPGTPYRPVGKVAHRAGASVVVHHGNHTVVGAGAKYTGRPLEVCHFPLRSRAQCERKYRKTWTGWEHNPRGDIARARGMSAAGRADAYYERVALTNRLVARGLADGLLACDTRVRDALRRLVNRHDAGAPPGPAPSDASRADRRRLLLDDVILDEATLVRLQRETDSVAAAVTALEARDTDKRSRSHG